MMPRRLGSEVEKRGEASWPLLHGIMITYISTQKGAYSIY